MKVTHLSDHQLAAFYSDARLNIRDCLNVIRGRTRGRTGKISEIKDDAGIIGALDSLFIACNTRERQAELIAQLRRRFRFINVLTDPKTKNKADAEKGSIEQNPEQIVEKLKVFLQVINLLRNTKVHPQDTETDLNTERHKALFFSLNDIYDASLNEIKKRQEVDEREVQFARRFGQKKTKGKGTLKPLNSFDFSLCADPKETSGDQPPSSLFYAFGHVFLCALFLEKKQAAELINYFWQANEKCKWTEQQKTFMQELISAHGVIVPLGRIKTDQSEASVTLDSLLELSRSPRVLFDTLSPQDKQKYQAKTLSAADIVPVSSPDEAPLDDGASFPMKRSHQNRFPAHMMSFLDFDDDNSLRFAIDLGNYYDWVRLKPGSDFDDGIPRTRALGRKIVAYAKLKDIQIANKNLPEYWQALEQNYDQADEEAKAKRTDLTSEPIDLKPYIIPTTPHYHYYDDKIGIRLEGNRPVAGYPVELGDKDTPGSGLAALHRKDMEPQFWLSPNQMTQLAFYAYLRKQHDNKGRFPEFGKLLERYQGGMHSLIQKLVDAPADFKSEPKSDARREETQQWVDDRFGNTDNNGQLLFTVKLADLPRVVCNHLMGATRTVTTDQIITRIEQMIEDTEKQERKLDFLLNSDKRRGKKGFKPLIFGRIADVITDDLMRFQPADPAKLNTDGGKLNSQQYQILQATLSYYARHIDPPPNVVSLLTNAKLYDETQAHPFLTELGLQQNPGKYPDLTDFYQAYLEERKRFLKNQLYGLSKGQVANSVPRWLRLKQRSTLDEWLKQVITKNKALAQPLPMPRGFLYEPILALVAKGVGLEVKALLDTGTQKFTRKGIETAVRPGFGWLVQKYLEYELNDESQKMYCYKRQHKLFKKFKPNTPNLYLDTGERIKRLDGIRQMINETQDQGEKKKREKVLWSYKRQERQIMQLRNEDMVQYLLARENLAAVFGEKSELVYTKLKSINHEFLNNTISHEVLAPDSDKIIFNPAIKLKNIGSLNALVKDRRLASLLAYYPVGEKRQEHAEILTELSNYRRTRVEVFDLVHKLEELILQRARDMYTRPTQIARDAIPEEHKATFGGRHGDYLYALYCLIDGAKRVEAGQQAVRSGALNLELFNKARLLRNAYSHNVYPETKYFGDIARAITMRETPEGEDFSQRHIAMKLKKKLEDLYQPWLAFLTV